MLIAWNDGDEDALDRLIDVVYPELRRVAHRYLQRRRAGESVESAALANEAYLKLVRAGGIRCENRAHFLALCSQIMRRILVDHAARAASRSVEEARCTWRSTKRCSWRGRAALKCSPWMRRSLPLPESTAGKSAWSSCVTSAD